jgi:tetrapyrrole methylase family protein/MazG family protein
LIGKAFEDLVNIMETLRSPEGCPWDKEQTHESLKPYLLEEAFEVLESIEENDFCGLKEELGDLMLQSVFHAQLAKENNQFTIQDVLDTINQKLIRRHPHVFGHEEINTADEQRIHWEKLKKHEGKTSIVDGVPKMLPSLLRARRVQQKAATVGFDWEKVDQVWEKVHEEIDELLKAVRKNQSEKIEEEFGDLLFALVNLARFLPVNPEEALRHSIDKFIHRFQKMEDVISQEGKDLRKMNLQEMDTIWNRIKKTNSSDNSIS